MATAIPRASLRVSRFSMARAVCLVPCRGSDNPWGSGDGEPCRTPARDTLLGSGVIVHGSPECRPFMLLRAQPPHAGTLPNRADRTQVRQLPNGGLESRIVALLPAGNAGRALACPSLCPRRMVGGTAGPLLGATPPPTAREPRFATLGRNRSSLPVGDSTRWLLGGQLRRGVSGAPVRRREPCVAGAPRLDALWAAAR